MVNLKQGDCLDLLESINDVLVDMTSAAITWISVLLPSLCAWFWLNVGRKQSRLAYVRFLQTGDNFRQ